jgi:hypothetical protein
MEMENVFVIIVGMLIPLGLAKILFFFFRNLRNLFGELSREECIWEKGSGGILVLFFIGFILLLTSQKILSWLAIIGAVRGVFAGLNWMLGLIGYEMNWFESNGTDTQATAREARHISESDPESFFEVPSYETPSKTCVRLGPDGSGLYSNSSGGICMGLRMGE